MWLTAATAALRFVSDAGLMFLFGSCGLLAATAGRDGPWQGGPSFLRTRRLAAALALAALFGILAMQAASVGDGWPSALDPSMLRAVMLQTGFGHAWMARLVLAALMSAVILASPRPGVAAMSAGLALAAASLTGHAAMHEGVLGIMQRLVQALHGLCAGAWVGSLVPFFWLLRALRQPGRHAAASRALRRFSRLGHVAVAGVLLTGAANTAFILGRWPVNWHSPYQALLAAKIGLTLLMVVLAIMNRYVWAPRFSHAPDATAEAIRLGTLGELAAAVLALALVCVLGLLEP
ncbi:MAG TPA: copper homeostasis membrane protein CopD [Bordetella sp.]